MRHVIYTLFILQDHVHINVKFTFMSYNNLDNSLYVNHVAALYFRKYRLVTTGHSQPHSPWYCEQLNVSISI